MVTWAQRPKLIFLTVCLSDCKDPNIKVEKDKLSFKAVGGTEKKEHAVDIIFFKEIDPEASVTTSLCREPIFRFKENSLNESVDIQI